ncbi:MAG: hypothetical protein AB8B97_12910 [Granulosicoccus sp.]
MQSLPEATDLKNRRTVSSWLVVILCIFPMIVPVFATLSANQGDLNVVALSRLTGNETLTARPLKAEVVDNMAVVPAGSDAPGISRASAQDMFQALLAVLGIACLGWRFTLRHHVRQIK